MSLTTRDVPPGGCPPPLQQQHHHHRQQYQHQRPSRLLNTDSSHHSHVTIKQEQDHRHHSNNHIIDIRPQSPLLPPPPHQPQLARRTTHPDILTPTPTPPPSSSSAPFHHPPVAQMRRTNKSPKPKERALKVQPPQEPVNYPCCEPLSEFYRQRMVEMELFPSDGVSRYTRRIPFKGSKGAFFETTGRYQFDVYEYRFTAPNILGDRKQWWIMWDYYNGLVRVHDFFDCCKPGKTEPANALKEKVNPGLANLCPNITGGNLHAQGYWFPFEAAKALAAKFCYKIRFALTIIFGEDFPSLCLPEDHEDFGKYSIDPAIIARCQQRADDQKRLETERRRRQSEAAAAAAVASAAAAAAAAATLTLSTPRYVTPAETTPAGSIIATASPEMGSMQQQQQREQGSRFFDAVRDAFTSGSSSSSGQRSDFPSPAGSWLNHEQDISSTTPPNCHHHMLSTVSPTLQYYHHHHQYGLPDNNSSNSSNSNSNNNSNSNTMPARAVRGTNNRHHPYHSNNPVRRSTPTPMCSPAMEGLAQILMQSPAENMIPSEVMQMSQLPQYGMPSAPSIIPEYTIYPPISRPNIAEQQRQSDMRYHFPAVQSMPHQRHKPPISQYKADLEHGSKRQRVSGQLSPSPEYFGPQLEKQRRNEEKEEEEEYTARIHKGSIIPASTDPYARSPTNTDAERDVAEAAAGLMDLRRKDIELEDCRRRNSA